jgi:hypothetical protein
VLFAYLVQSLMGLDVIGLNYPGHVATAVCFNEEVAGDYFEVNGKRYVIADPTYINAPVGLTMPEYKNQQAEIIPLSNTYVEGRRQEVLWDEIIAAGGNRGDNGRDLIVNADGSKLVAGYFTGAFNYADIDAAGKEMPLMFTMMVNAQNQPLWFINSSGSGTSIAYNLQQDNQENYYVAGTFSGGMEIGDHKLVSNGEIPDLFVAKFNASGNVLWLEKANVDTANTADADGQNYLNFVAKFSPGGQHLGNDLYFESGNFRNYGISIAPKEVVVAGAFNKTTGMNMRKISVSSSGSFDAVEAIKSENDKLISDDYEKTIAGLFAVVNLIQSSGVSIPGSAARDVLDKYNPDFKNSYPEIYKTILKIHFLKNQEGIVTLKTDDKMELSIDMMRVKNDSKLKISMLESGDARIDMLSGVRVGKALWWYDLNHIILYKSNGDLLFDYDSDHEIALKNLKEDILY